MTEEKQSPPPAPTNQDKTAGNPPASPPNQEITKDGMAVKPSSPINAFVTNTSRGKPSPPINQSVTEDKKK